MYPVGLRPLSNGLLGLCGGSNGPFTSRSTTSRTKRCVSVKSWTAWSWFAARISTPLICTEMKREGSQINLGRSHEKRNFKNLTAMTRSPTWIFPSRCAIPPSVRREMKIPSFPSTNEACPLPPAMLKPRPCPIWSRIRVVCKVTLWTESVPPCNKCEATWWWMDCSECGALCCSGIWIGAGMIFALLSLAT